ncbi:MAG: hypothetical protein ACFFCT_09310, partial [Candidatus Odinarchaeota archaeon]
NYTINNIDIYTLMKDYFDENPLSVTSGPQPDFQIDPMMVTAIVAGAAVAIVVILVLLKRR